MITAQIVEIKKHIPAAMGRLVALIILSLVLGLTFNASNPTGVRFSEKSESTGATPAVNEGKSAVTKDPSSPYDNVTVSVALTTRPKPATITTPAPMPAAVALTSPTTKPHNHGGPNPTPIAWDDAAALLKANSALLVDARPKSTFDAGHIPGAVSLPEAAQNFDIVGFQKKYSPETVIITYCANTDCPVSLKLAYRLMHDYGYKSVRYMPGGYQEWQRHQATRKP